MPIDLKSLTWNFTLNQPGRVYRRLKPKIIVNSTQQGLRHTFHPGHVQAFIAKIGHETDFLPRIIIYKNLSPTYSYPISFYQKFQNSWYCTV